MFTTRTRLSRGPSRPAPRGASESVTGRIGAPFHGEHLQHHQLADDGPQRRSAERHPGQGAKHPPQPAGAVVDLPVRVLGQAFERDLAAVSEVPPRPRLVFPGPAQPDEFLNDVGVTAKRSEQRPAQRPWEAVDEPRLRV